VGTYLERNSPVLLEEPNGCLSEKTEETTKSLMIAGVPSEIRTKHQNKTAVSNIAV
jgi:hypothetical protein